MNFFLIIAFLFFIGSVLGWVLELFYRHFAAEDKKWMNPGFCTGPYLPLYGTGLCLLYLIASLENYDLIKNPVLNKIALFALMAVCMTAIEYVAGILALKVVKVRLWDYSDEWGNIQGIICPKFSVAWAALGALYYFLIHPYILNALSWLSQNLAFSFFIGLFFGVFIIDAVNSVQLVAKLKKYAEENDIIVKYESLKSHIRERAKERSEKYHFFRAFRSEIPLSDHLKDLVETFEKRLKKK